ncbi:hypothetical protein SELMODRAFT_88434 [Selaginella moellendorffii]|uniref:Phosphatidic acid phosphatase type 2/haloperoxidase domain-containing protein n=1 Tax=Selaginella moellendorffii TaxID=88036 RepID=D8RAC0_SELML|nr:lipid phosphate phosphatase delta [Selaginella moellendorffii]EFJ31042.1 hypothetical protein SELMODRAFT_88434 [Selaginella moellendorffii]|eukprot:XP_002967695.1 lipid phosphate phosphatase delta [Selaginella moellendorffii]
MEAVGVPVWQVITLVTILSWLRFSSFTNLTLRARSILQPLVTQRVLKGTETILHIQRSKNPFWDVVFAVASSVVSVEFYTAFLPLLFWCGQTRLARQMTILMAVCIYVGNCVKDVVSAPRPASPPVRRLTAIKCEEESAMEFGLPSSHTINTICLSLYLFNYFMNHQQFPSDSRVWWLVLGIICLVIVLVAYGRLYLGMHTPIDVYAGIPIGLCLLMFWCCVDDHIDQFVTEGENVLPFWTSMSFLVLFAYPRPEYKTPSFEFHTAFNGVVLGVVYGSHRFYSYGQTTALSISTLQDTLNLILRLAIGFPTVLAVKELSKELAKQLLPWVCRAFFVPIYSSSYVPPLQEKAKNSDKKSSPRDEETRNLWLRLLPVIDEDHLDVDTGIRLLQYAALGWSVAELAPSIFQYLGV